MCSSYLLYTKNSSVPKLSKKNLGCLKNTLYESSYNALFSVPRGVPRRVPVSAFGGNSKPCGFGGGSANLSKRCLAIHSFFRNGEAQFYMCLPRPPSARTTTPAVFRKHYKTAGAGSLQETLTGLCLYSSYSYSTPRKLRKERTR